VALEEAMLNAIVHGNLEVSSDLRQVDESAFSREIELRRSQQPYAGRRVKVTARVSSREAAFMIQDEGPGFDVSKVPNPTDPANLGRVGGRGILLMRSFMNSVHYSDEGRRVTLVRRRS
jgi:anti-sigma regulatory factor (Ser/Thr protein kinase)